VNAAGLILAAGESRRMGSPKALLPYRGQTFLDTLVESFSSRCSTVIVVLGADAETVRAGVTRPATFVVNPDYRLGQTTSMQAGLRHIPPHADGVLFTLVDHPAVASSTIDALLSEHSDIGDAPRPLIRVPRYGDSRGHPVWFSRQLIPEFLALPPTGAAREVVRLHLAETAFLDVDDPGILADIDDPAAYRALMGSAV
jgi:molybdenum cofactor cytidylyltransferase